MKTLIASLAVGAALAGLLALGTPALAAPCPPGTLISLACDPSPTPVPSNPGTAFVLPAFPVPTNTAERLIALRACLDFIIGSNRVRTGDATADVPHLAYAELRCNAAVPVVVLPPVAPVPVVQGPDRAVIVTH